MRSLNLPEGFSSFSSSDQDGVVAYFSYVHKSCWILAGGSERPGNAELLHRPGQAARVLGLHVRDEDRLDAPDPAGRARLA